MDKISSTKHLSFYFATHFRGAIVLSILCTRFAALLGHCVSCISLHEIIGEESEGNTATTTDATAHFLIFHFTPEDVRIDMISVENNEQRNEHKEWCLRKQMYADRGTGPASRMN